MIYRVYISLSRVRGPYCKLGTEVFLLQFMYYCVALHCIALHYIALYCIALHSWFARKSYQNSRAF